MPIQPGIPTDMPLGIATTPVTLTRFTTRPEDSSMKTLRIWVWSGCVVALSAAGCTASGEPMGDVEARPSAAVVPPVAADVSQGAGFIHTAARSKFRIGAGTVSKFESGLQKTVGSDGVFA